MMSLGWVSWTVLAPAIGGVLLLFVPRDHRRLLQAFALTAAGISLLSAGMTFLAYDPKVGGYQLVDKFDWIPSMGVNFHMGVDGINAVLLFLTAICSFTGVWVACQVKDRLKEYLVFYLFLCVGCFGVLTSLNVFFMYFFYETAVIPVYPLIGSWGSGDKKYASMKLTLYLTLGAVLALFGIFAIYHTAGLESFDFPVLQTLVAAKPFTVEFQKAVFPLIMLGFGVILTLWPLHTWSPMGYAAAPTSVSMLHAGVLKKLGAYLIIRLGITLLPDGARFWMPWVAWLAAVNIVYCGLVAFRQKDLKYILGYSSCSHMGLILLGLASLNTTALNGTILYMFAHGVMAALSFSLVGFVYEQTHRRELQDWGGLGKKIPFIATLFVMAAMASSGVPGFATFMGEALILFGAWGPHPIPALCGIAGLVITAGYMLKTVRATIQGPLNPACEAVQDAKGIRRLPYLLLITALLVGGLWPKTFLSVSEGSVRAALGERALPTSPQAAPLAAEALRA